MNKKALQSLIFAGGLAVGATGAGFYFHQSEKQVSLPQSQLTTLYDDLFDKKFFSQSRSPVLQMEKKREDMDKFFSSSLQDFPKVTFKDWYGSKFGGNIGEMKYDEDSKFVTYKVDLSGIDPETLKTDISGGQVTISASGSKMQAQEEEGVSQKTNFQQSFHRSFPVPEGVDPNRVEIKQSGNELIIKFPKVTIGDKPIV
jgi:HSP20 family molecular chaperone IbpA